MKKAVVLIIMVFICGIYIYSIRGKVAKVKKNKPTQKELLEQIKEDILTSYPPKLQEVIEIANQILMIQYSKEMQEEDIALAVETNRLLYAKELLDMNVKEVQEENLKQQIALNKLQSAYMIGSKVEGIEYNKQDKTAQATVIYYTTKSDIQREYELIQEDNQWKLYTWEDTRISIDETSKNTEESNEAN